jgi:hypothetical protein
VLSRIRLPASQDQSLGQRAQRALYTDSIRAGFRPRTSPPTPRVGFLSEERSPDSRPYRPAHREQPRHQHEAVL